MAGYDCAERCIWPRFSRCNPVLKPFYLRLRAAGKPAKVALVAVMASCRSFPTPCSRPAAPGDRHAPRETKALSNPPSQPLGEGGLYGAPHLTPNTVASGYGSPNAGAHSRGLNPAALPLRGCRRSRTRGDQNCAHRIFNCGAQVIRSARPCDREDVELRRGIASVTLLQRHPKARAGRRSSTYFPLIGFDLRRSRSNWVC
jgi:hypothetical protein